MKSIKDYIKQCEKKRCLIMITIGAVIVASTISLVLIRHHLHKSTPYEATAYISTEESTTQIVTEQLQSVSETEAPETSVPSTKKNPPKVKPVGTTVPVEKYEAPITERTEQPSIDYSSNSLKLLNVPYINQNEKYPTDCESVSAVMALRYAGYNISPENYIDAHLPKGTKPFYDSTGNMFGDDPRECFLGNPYAKNGWGCYAPVIQKGLNEVIDRSRHKVLNVTGSSMSELCKKYIDNDYPVIIWATQGMSAPRTGKTWYFLDKEGTFTWIAPNHCLLLVGYDDGGYYFNDPQTDKNYRYEKSIVESRFASLGKQALVIVKYVPPVTETMTEETSREIISSETSTKETTQELATETSAELTAVENEVI